MDCAEPEEPEGNSDVVCRRPVEFCMPAAEVVVPSAADSVDAVVAAPVLGRPSKSVEATVENV